MRKTADILKDHPVNAARLADGKKQANSIWLWGQGGKPQMVPLTQKYDFKGGMISAVDLLNGLGINTGLKHSAWKGLRAISTPIMKARPTWRLMR